MFVSFRLLVVESIYPHHEMSYFRFPLEPRDSRLPPRVYKDWPKPNTASISDATIQMDHNAVVLFTIDPLARSPRRRCGRWAPESPRPVGYKINLRFRRFGYGTGQLTGLTRVLHFSEPKLLATVCSDPHLANIGHRPGPATISPCTITMDHDAIICSMIDRLAWGPDQDVHVQRGQPKMPFYNVDVNTCS